MAFSGIGIVAGAELTEAARRAGADHVEPAITSNLAVRGEAQLGEAQHGGAQHGDRWRRNEFYAGQRFPSFALFVPPDLPLLTAEPDRVDDYFAQVLPMVASVAEPGAVIVFGSGTARTAPDGMPVAVARERFARGVRSARDTAAEHDLRIVLEPLNRSETNLVHTIAEAVAFLDEQDLGDVDVVADLFHVQAESESFDVVRDLAARIGHVHVSDHDREPPGDSASAWPWPAFLAAVHDGGYRGLVSLECRWDEDPEPRMAAALALVRAATEHRAATGHRAATEHPATTEQRV
ncbi:sugar phosphate isomerase/epimerase [Curtobacterium sp. PhB130]|uniref:sugar phosphate isomerase/epimerase family protein n=1 Tax=Curtobacterium sp. PhB130 TaxID=2485178 RepID=UPI000F4C4BCB|nr:sugar phosphate isomerase/epimerase family protein [Curtobacterium sp. PhB130]ROS75067.1 sugar phosphate isomerase/epimerase [Curtobacterium sp. PhB130]